MSAYGAGHIKRSPRRTKQEMSAIRESIITELAADHPQTLRQLFYRLVSRGVLAKTEQEYSRTLSRLVVDMRRSGDVPYGWIADQTRWARRTLTFSSVEEALAHTAQTYRRALWNDALVVPEIWCEKDALVGVLAVETMPWDVALMPCRGYSSLTFLHAAAEVIKERFDERGQQTAIYYFGDHDPSGVDIDHYIMASIGRSLCSLCFYLPDGGDDDDWDEAFHDMASFERVAVTPSQITSLNLQTRPTKRNPKDYRARKFVGDSVEVDAIPARMLRTLAASCIEQHVNRREVEILKTIETEERAGILKLTRHDREPGPLNDSPAF